MSMKRTSVAVIGVGTMGMHHARNFFELKEADLKAVVDKDKDQARRVASKYNCHWYSHTQELLTKEDIKAVSVAVPTLLHFSVVSDCLRAGKHVFVEKPITSRSTQAYKLIKQAEKRGLILAVGHIERFNPAVAEFKKYLDEGKIGEIVSLSARRVGLYPPSYQDTNVIIDLAIHDIDVFAYLLEKEPIKIYALGGKALRQEREDYAQVLLSYKGEVHGIIQVNWITPVKIRELAVTGTKGLIELDYINQKLTIYRSKVERRFESFEEFLAKFGRPQVIDISIAGEEPLKIELSHFIDCVREGRACQVDGRIGLKALKIAEKILDRLKT